MNLWNNPYRLFFGLGTSGLLVGLGVWVFTGLINPNIYLGQLHAHYMIGIFLLSFVVGFLMTAIPRMSGTWPATRVEISIQLLTLLISAFLGIFEQKEKFFFVSVLCSLLVLLFFCGRRILKSPNHFPDIFPMVIMSLTSGVMGSIAFIFDHSHLGARLFYLNFILGLCVGVGAKLIPMILRLGCSYRYSKGEMWLVGSILTLSCFIDSFYHETIGSSLRAIVMFWVFIKYWKVHHFNGFNSALTIGIRLAAFSIFLGTVGLLAFPNYRLEALHVLYVSGFSLLTIMVASRVILSHGNFDLNLEFKNWFIKLPVGLIILAAATRVSAIFVDGRYESHLAYAALSFLLGICVWSIFFIPKMFSISNH